VAGDYENKFYAALDGCPDVNARRALSQIMSVFKAVRRARPGLTMTEGDVDAVLVFPRLFTYDLPNNPFWVHHASVLGPQLQLAVMDWIESAAHAPTTDYNNLDAAGQRRWIEAKEREVSTRATVYSFVVQAVMLAGGSVEGLRERLTETMVGD